MGERRNAYRILVGKPDVKRPLRRPRRRWVDNIKMDLREVGWEVSSHDSCLLNLAIYGAGLISACFKKNKCLHYFVPAGENVQ
jgi:hypothetical protein